MSDTRKCQKKVMVFGTFDLVHPGHLDFFRQAKAYGDLLVVQVGRDDVVEKIKGKPPHYTQEERLAMIKELRIVDKALIGHPSDWTAQILEEGPDVLCLGYDQEPGTIMEDLAAQGFTPQLIILEPYEAHRHKSSIVKALAGNKIARHL